MIAETYNIIIGRGGEGGKGNNQGLQGLPSGLYNGDGEFLMSKGGRGGSAHYGGGEGSVEFDYPYNRTGTKFGSGNQNCDKCNNTTSASVASDIAQQEGEMKGSIWGNSQTQSVSTMGGDFTEVDPSDEPQISNGLLESLLTDYGSPHTIERSYRSNERLPSGYDGIVLFLLPTS